MKKNILTIIFLPVLLYGCAVQYPNLVKNTDPYSGEKGMGFGPVKAKSCSNSYPYFGEVSMYYLRSGEDMAIDISYIGNDWVFINADRGLKMLIDGEVYKLNGIKNSESREVSSGKVIESALYEVEKDIIKKIAGADQVQFRVSGSRGQIDKCFYKEQTEIFNELIKEWD